MGRGLACADFDLDGDEDVLMTINNGSPRLLRNDSRGAQKNNALRVELQGTKSNRSGISALVWAEMGSKSLRRRVHSGSSYSRRASCRSLLAWAQALRQGKRTRIS